MRLKLRIVLLICLVTAAIATSIGAYKTLRPAKNLNLPEEVYASFTAKADSAQFYLKESGGYVAVFEDDRARAPMAVTTIELSCLRTADRAMIEAGIPVCDTKELLQVLEDLGS